GLQLITAHTDAATLLPPLHNPLLLHRHALPLRVFRLAVAVVAAGPPGGGRRRGRWTGTASAGGGGCARSGGRGRA
uniref:Uncharacterized protein n=1 Tax=Oryza meridionalis TaxID=40149 RepID=A0A0E0CGX0_9ORYZ